MARTLVATVLLTAGAVALVVPAYRHATRRVTLVPIAPGSNWKRMTLDVLGPPRDARLFEDVAIRDDGVGLAVRRVPPRLMRTTDGGYTWKDGPVPQVARYATALRPDGVALLAGTGGVIHRSIDAGVTWKQAAKFPNMDSVTKRQIVFRRITFGVGDHVVAVGDGIVLSSSDAGLTWQRANVPPQSYNGLDYRSGVWLAVGSSGVILRSADDGLTWTQQSVPARPLLRGVAFADSSNAVAVGADGVILRSADAGLTWQPVSSGTTQHLRAVAFADAHIGWAAGFYGTLLHTGDGGISWQSEESGTRAHLFDLIITPKGLPLAAGFFDSILMRATLTTSAEAEHVH